MIMVGDTLVSIFPTNDTKTLKMTSNFANELKAIAKLKHGINPSKKTAVLVSSNGWNYEGNFEIQTKAIAKADSILNLQEFHMIKNLFLRK